MTEIDKKSMRALVPGSFDPVTAGHFDIIRRASEEYGEVLAYVFVNPEKKTLFTIAERAELLHIACAGLDNVRAGYNEGMLAEFALANGIGEIVKGIRSQSDMEYELAMAEYNAKAAPGIKTVFYFSDSRFADISSTAAREMLTAGFEGGTFTLPENVRRYLAPGTAAAVTEMMKKKLNVNL